MYVTPIYFITNQLPATESTVQLVVSSYNSVFGYRKGVTEKEINGIKVTVQSGYMLPASLLKRILGNNNPYHEVQERLCSEVSTLNRVDEVKLFVILYAGLNYFNQVLECATSIKKTQKESQVYVLTCDCELIEKKERMRKSLLHQEVDGFIVSRECGGGVDLMNILFAFLEKCKQ